MGSSAGHMVARKARRSRGQEPVQGSGSRPESVHRVCCGSPQNHWVTWLRHKTKTEGSVGGDGIQTHREASMPGDMRWDREACSGIAGLASGGCGLWRRRGLPMKRIAT
jgi:hypothetical protein